MSTEGNIGYIGLGSMGGALARRLQLSHPLHVFDRDEDAIASLIESGARRCNTLREVGEACRIIFLCLPTSEHVRAVLFGEDGLAAALRSGTMIVDQTTGDPAITREMAAELSRRGIALIDAPVSGGPHGAAAGTIAIMVGAGAQEWARIQPVLSAISPRIFHAGDVGAGHVIKLVNNVILAGERALTLEAVALAAKNGIEPATAAEILGAGGARNGFIETQLKSGVVRGNLNVGFTLGLMLKDVRLACKLGSDSAVPMLYGSLTREFFQMCLNEMGNDAQLDTAALVIDRIAGTHVVPQNSNRTGAAHA